MLTSRCSLEAAGKLKRRFLEALRDSWSLGGLNSQETRRLEGVIRFEMVEQEEKVSSSFLFRRRRFVFPF